MSDKTDIWYLIGTLAVGGAERTLIDLVNGLDKELFNPTIFTIAEPGPLAADLDDNIRLRPLNAVAKYDIRVPLALVQAIRAEKPDIIQSFLFFDNTLARLTKIGTSNVTVITGVRSVPNNPDTVRASIDRITLPLSDHIVSNSETGAKLAEHRGASSENVSVIRNGRNIDRYANATAPQALYEEFDLTGNEPVVGTVGRLLERKGHHDLLDAWPGVLETHPDAKLLFVGDGPEREALINHVRQLDCGDAVIFAGMRDDVPELLDLFNIFAFPSHFEGLPGALLEAMAASLPIVATPVNGNSELVVDGQSGVHVPVRSPVALGSAIEQLLSNPTNAETLGMEAQQRAKELFSLESMVSQFEALYGDLV